MNYRVIIPYLLEGTVTAIQLFALTLLLAVPLGLLVAKLRGSRFVWLTWPLRFYLLIMRGTPLLLQLIRSEERRVG